MLAGWDGEGAVTVPQATSRGSIGNGSAWTSATATRLTSRAVPSPTQAGKGPDAIPFGLPEVVAASFQFGGGGLRCWCHRATRQRVHKRLDDDHCSDRKNADPSVDVIAALADTYRLSRSRVLDGELLVFHDGRPEFARVHRRDAQSNARRIYHLTKSDPKPGPVQAQTRRRTMRTSCAVSAWPSWSGRSRSASTARRNRRRSRESLAGLRHRCGEPR